MTQENDLTVNSPGILTTSLRVAVMKVEPTGPPIRSSNREPRYQRHVIFTTSSRIRRLRSFDIERYRKSSAPDNQRVRRIR
jgi:hypothetical protein